MPDIRAAYAVEVGQRLRSLRKQQRLSLHSVEESTAMEFKASVLGAYERGERTISVPRLQRLAHFYGIPVDQLLPRSGAMRDDEDHGGCSSSDWTASRKKLIFDLSLLPTSDPNPEREMIARYVMGIQLRRQDFNGRVMTVRDDDLRAMAFMLDVDPAHMEKKLEQLGLTA